MAQRSTAQHIAAQRSMPPLTRPSGPSEAPAAQSANNPRLPPRPEPPGGPCTSLEGWAKQGSSFRQQTHAAHVPPAASSRPAGSRCRRQWARRSGAAPAGPCHAPRAPAQLLLHGRVPEQGVEAASLRQLHGDQQQLLLRWGVARNDGQGCTVQAAGVGGSMGSQPRPPRQFVHGLPALPRVPATLARGADSSSPAQRRPAAAPRVGACTFAAATLPATSFQNQCPAPSQTPAQC